MVIRYNSTREGTGLIIPKYSDYTSLLIPFFYGNQKPHASGTHHSLHTEEKKHPEIHKCEAENCQNESIYKLPKSAKRACSLGCFKWLKEHEHKSRHHESQHQLVA